MIAIEFKNGEFRAKFSDLISQTKNPNKLLMASGRGAANALRKHFEKLDRTRPNKLSERRSFFWDKVKRSVQNPYVLGNTATVSINEPRFAQKVFGGTIRAKAAGALAIPVEERAYDRYPGTFEQETGLKLFLVKTGKGAFQNAVLAVHEKGQAGFTVEYVLTPSVNQQPDPDALPPRSALEAAILNAAQRSLDNEKNPE